ncbi:Ig-like domain-containing protein [Ferruginibacter albus]|uniref:Ig-like domain-containing protein n=1 Tax=Ferruginibacter albus TaxID=2875540 RepID=UPI001CC66F27|nr:Ig-like domain-containing protein [Ferruginibacter albus]UAY53263.1 hypothetical protein K9M53_06220 [Ferruginibacter albus]
MKKNFRPFNVFVFVCFFAISSTKSYAQIFSQTFAGHAIGPIGGSSATYITDADYYTTSSEANKFSNIACGAIANLKIGINPNGSSGDFTVTDGASAGFFLLSRKNFASQETTPPTAIKITFNAKFDVSSQANAGVARFIFQIGSKFSDAWSSYAGAMKEPYDNVFAGIVFRANNSTSGATIYENDNTTQIGSSTIGESYSTWTLVLNNSGSTLIYTSPTGSLEAVANRKYDIWIGTTKWGDDLSAPGVNATLTDFKFATIDNLATGQIGISLQDFKIDNLLAVGNTAPSFLTTSPSLTVNQNSCSADFKSLMNISDIDPGQTETWTQSSAPAHGTLTIINATADSDSTNIAPKGIMTYTPAAGYSGSDAFTIQVSDGKTTITKNVMVIINAIQPADSQSTTNLYFNRLLGREALLSSIEIGTSNSLNNGYLGAQSYVLGYKDTVQGSYMNIIGQLNKVDGGANTVVGKSNICSGNASVILGRYNKAEIAVETYLLGSNNKTNSSVYTDASYAIGRANQICYANAYAVGYKNITGAYEAISVGVKNAVTGDMSSVFGYGNTITDTQAVAVGYQNKVTKRYGLAFGKENEIGGLKSVAIGTHNIVTAQKALALGRDLTISNSIDNPTQFDNSVKIGVSDNAYMVLLQSGNVGIGTTPESNTKLQVNGNVKAIGLIIPTGAAYGKVLTSDSNGLASWQMPTGNNSNDALWSLSGNDLSSSSTANIGIGVNKVPIGYKLAVNGDALFTKIKVKAYNATTWPDYVFADNYNLPKLKEVEQYLKQNKHLRGIPSALEIQTNGIDVADNEAALLQKIEELTLYVIDENKKNEDLSKQVMQHNQQLQELQQQLQQVMGKLNSK